MRIQMEFTNFPGVEPFATERGWRHLPLPHRTVDADDFEAMSDAVMELVDYAMERDPDAFGFDWNDAVAGCEHINDLSIDLADRVHAATEGHARVRGDGGAWAEWYQDAELAEGVTIRVACFR